EQAKGKEADRTSDVWSFGCVLYEMLTGRAVFGGETVGEIFGEIFKRGPEWDRLPAETPRDIRRLLRRCLQKDPKQRLQHIDDARIELNEAKSDSESDAHLASRALRHGARTAWIVAGVAMLAAVALAAALYVVSRPGETQRLHLSMTLPEGWSLALSSSLGE